VKVVIKGLKLPPLFRRLLPSLTHHYSQTSTSFTKAGFRAYPNLSIAHNSLIQRLSSISPSDSNTMKPASLLLGFALGAVAQSQIMLGRERSDLILQGYGCEASDRCAIPGGASVCTSTNLIKRDLTATTSRNCAPICRAEPTCKSYAAGADGCWLYSDIVEKCEGPSGALGWQYSDRNCFPTKSEHSCDQPGGVSPCSWNNKLIRHDTSATTPQTCGLVCRAEPTCRSYAAGPDGCWLYSDSIDICKGAKGGSGWSYSDRDCYPTTPGDSCGRPGGASLCTSTNLIKRDLTATTSRKCAPICRAEPTCKSYAAGADGCWLYSAGVNKCEGASGGYGWAFSDRDCYPNSSLEV